MHFDVSLRDGTLVEGASIEVTFQPTDWLVSNQAVRDVVLPIVDYTFGTRERLLHRVHVGLDGYTIWPDAAFDGEGLGVVDGETRNYTVTNRWIVLQDMTVQASEPWIEFEELGGSPVPGTTPLDFTLFPVGGPVAPEFSFQASVKGDGLVPNVYTGEITWTSLDGGSPPVELTNAVRFDYCRDKTVALDVPASYTLPAFGGEQEHTLLVPTGAGLLIEDVDVVVARSLPSGGGNFKPDFGFSIRGPSAVEVLLKDPNQLNGPDQDFFDDETTPGEEFLNDLDGEPSFGTWILILKNKDNAPKPIDVDLSRLEIRVHHQNVTVCTQ